jgi:hypothetical protein
MTTQHKSFKNISGGSRNNVLRIYIHLKVPKSRETVPLITLTATPTTTEIEQRNIFS